MRPRWAEASACFTLSRQVFRASSARPASKSATVRTHQASPSRGSSFRASRHRDSAAAGSSAARSAPAIRVERHAGEGASAASAQRRRAASGLPRCRNVAAIRSACDQEEPAASLRCSSMGPNTVSGRSVRVGRDSIRRRASDIRRTPKHAAKALRVGTSPGAASKARRKLYVARAEASPTAGSHGSAGPGGGRVRSGTISHSMNPSRFQAAGSVATRATAPGLVRPPRSGSGCAIARDLRPASGARSPDARASRPRGSSVAGR